MAGQSAHLLSSFAGGIGTEAGRDDDEFIAAHAGHIVVFAAAVFQGLGKEAQHTVAFQMAEAVVDLLEAVHVRNHDGERDIVALAAGQLTVELHEQGAGIGKSGEIVGGGGVLGLRVLERVLDRERHFAADRQENAEVIGCKSVTFGAIQRQYADDSGNTLEWHSQR